MARPKTDGLEYYPKDTDSFSDRKIRKLLREFGCKGYVIHDYLRCVIYQDKGYYVAYDDGLSFDVADFLGDSISEALVNEVIKGCVRIGLFDVESFNKNRVLTSNGIQKRYMNIKKSGVIDEKYRVSPEETPENDEESTQRKGKKSKVNEIKEKEIPPEHEFLEYCKSEIENYGSLEFSLKAKYQQWVDNGWRDGFDKPIKNWKSKILNTIPYLKEKSSAKKENGNTKAW